MVTPLHKASIQNTPDQSCCCLAARSAGSMSLWPVVSMSEGMMSLFAFLCFWWWKVLRLLHHFSAKQTRRQSLTPTRFCLRGQGYVPDQIIICLLLLPFLLLLYILHFLPHFLPFLPLKFPSPPLLFFVFFFNFLQFSFSYHLTPPLLFHNAFNGCCYMQNVCFHCRRWCRRGDCMAQQSLDCRSMYGLPMTDGSWREGELFPHHVATLQQIVGIAAVKQI